MNNVTTLKQILIGGAIVATCLSSGYIHVKYYRVFEVDGVDMSKDFIRNIEYVMKCNTLGKVNKENYDWYFENVYRLYFDKDVNGKVEHWKIDPAKVLLVQREINRYITEESNTLIPDSYYENACKLKVNNAMSQMVSLLEQHDVVYRYFGKY